MVLAKAGRSAATWVVSLLAATTAVATAGAASAAGLAGEQLVRGGPPWAFLSALFTVSCLVLLGIFLRFGDVARHRHDKSLLLWLDELDLPAAIAATDGRLLWSNRVLGAQVGGVGRTILEALTPLAEIDAQTIYRVATSAREIGFGFEPVTRQASRESGILSARLAPPDRLVWSLLPPDSLPMVTQEFGAMRFEDAPFAYLQMDSSGEAAGNARLRELFGAPPASLLALLASARQTQGERILFASSDGHEHLCRVFVLSDDHGPGAASGSTSSLRPAEAFIFPIAPDQMQRSGAMAALDAVPVALMQLDLDGRMLWHNAPAREMIGRDIEPGAALEDLVISLGRPIAALLAEAVEDSRGRREMMRLRSGDFDIFLQISLTLVTLDETPTLLAVLTDASELRQLEDKFVQSQKMEAVGKLAGGVAHDFNNVLTAISGHSDLLLLGKDALHPDYSDLIQVRQNTHRAAALVRQLLAFSRKQTLNPTQLSVQDVVSDTQYLLDRLIGERVTLKQDHGRDLGSVRADKQQIEQALMNLVVNARDAMPSGGTVTIATQNRTFSASDVHHGFEIPAGEYVEIAVTDEGTGIGPQVIVKVFDPFFTTKPLGEGTGLGLSTVYGIIKQSGGYVFAENREPGGACFRILLPRTYPGVADPLPVRAPQPDEHGDLTGRGAILLVEDEGPVRSFASRALRLRGYEVLEAASAEEAMALLERSVDHIDLLVSDVVMPGTDGPTFAAHARRMRPGLPVVFISGYAEDSFRRNLVEHDFLFLPKPFSLVDLTAKVKEALDRSRQSQEH